MKGINKTVSPISFILFYFIFLFFFFLFFFIFFFFFGVFFVSKDNLLDNNFTWQVRVRQSAVWKVSNRYTGPKKKRSSILY